MKVAFSKKNVRLVDVTAKRHWTWELAQTGDKKLTVTFKHGSDTYTFMAAIGRHGKLTAKVDHPVTKVTPSAPSAGSSTWVASSGARARASSLSTRATARAAAHMKAEEQMTDERRTTSTGAQKEYTKYTTLDEGVREKAAPRQSWRPRQLAPASSREPTAPLGSSRGGPLGPATPLGRRRPDRRGGIGIAAMMGLVANMEVADGHAKAVTPAKSSAVSAQRTAKGVAPGSRAAPGKVAAAKVKRPIVLTPHAVVHTVSAPSSGGY